MRGTAVDRHSIWAGLALACVLASCGSQPEKTISMPTLNNLTYAGIYRTPVTLQNGTYEGQPFVQGGAARPRVQLVSSLQVYGDLDGDGSDETAVFLTESSAGSGTITWLAVVAQRNGQAMNVATRRIGDRVQIRSLTYKKGTLVLDMIAAGPHDPACCPTLKIRNTYRLDSGQLVEVESRKEGQVSLRDLEGRIWRLTRFPTDTPVPDGITVNIVFKEDKVAGTGGCNRYFASIKNNAAEEIAIGPISSTRMACPLAEIDMESRYLQALQNVERFSFLAGDLILTWQDKTGVHAMRFAGLQGEANQKS